MKKRDLIQAVAIHADVDKKTATAVVEGTIDVILAAVAKGDVVNISNLGASFRRLGFSWVANHNAIKNFVDCLQGIGIKNDACSFNIVVELLGSSCANNCRRNIFVLQRPGD
ncbi:MAG: hypothetical protein EB144_06575 [Actinobacteria bacterium]|nr:hypothetical protein [Actinomycetota bacterium]